MVENKKKVAAVGAIGLVALFLWLSMQQPSPPSQVIDAEIVNFTITPV